MGQALRLGQAGGRALRPHDQLYSCITNEIHVQHCIDKEVEVGRGEGGWEIQKSLSRKLPKCP